ncbi:SGNH/GDSL hydrolase family protein [Paenibacillus sp. N3.4]|uniref:SGNH/GDSL hydrolase family protein n=1 Tax=Paenibacillus sp. N3.4 TaxID=2603222 RepID=UPI0021C385BA|nr:SGNH/GDSL hydrolase family protein [Paenibacillus sp. N3.4]
MLNLKRLQKWSSSYPLPQQALQQGKHSRWTRILVDVPMNTGTIVAIGDSLTDGASATVDANSRWTNFLAERLVSRNMSVLNAGISGGRLLRNIKGTNVLARFDSHVLNQPNVKSVIVIIGSNDIHWYARHGLCPYGIFTYG